MTAATPQFRMIDVGRKRTTRRRAIATGTITVGKKVFDLIKSGKLPKGDALALAEVAGITGAKKTPEILLMCHPLPLDAVTVHHALEAPDTVRIYCQAVAHAKTGVEMEAIMGVQAALATVWDLSKGTEPNLTIGDIRLLVKEGGKSGIWTNPDGIPDWLAAQLPDAQPLKDIAASIIVSSDRASTGEYKDASGIALRDALEKDGASVGDIQVVADDKLALETALHACKTPLVFITGGTGIGPRDITPDVLEAICERMLVGFGETLRAESAALTDMAWLSRMCAGIDGDRLLIALPGSPKAVAECWEILRPLLPHALKITKGGGHD